MPGPDITTEDNGTDVAFGNNSSIASVEQGPDWVMDVFFTPPGWVNPLLKVAGLLALVAVLYRLYQWGGDIPLDRQRAMQQIASTVIMITTATLAAVNLASWPYAVDVVVGFLVGYGSVFAVFWLRPSRWMPGLGSDRERVLAGWFVVCGASVVLPKLAMTNGVGVALTKSRFMLAGLAVVMALLNIRVLDDSAAGQAA